MFPGDTVDVEIDGLGRLTNHVVDGPPAPPGIGFPATVTRTSLRVALGSDYHRLRSQGLTPSAAAYRDQRDDLIATNITNG